MLVGFSLSRFHGNQMQNYLTLLWWNLKMVAINGSVSVGITESIFAEKWHLYTMHPFLRFWSSWCAYSMEQWRHSVPENIELWAEYYQTGPVREENVRRQKQGLHIVIARSIKELTWISMYFFMHSRTTCSCLVIPMQDNITTRGQITDPMKICQCSNIWGRHYQMKTGCMRK
jgi:hypothetical protein